MVRMWRNSNSCGGIPFAGLHQQIPFAGGNANGLFAFAEPRLVDIEGEVEEGMN